MGKSFVAKEVVGDTSVTRNVVIADGMWVVEATESASHTSFWDDQSLTLIGPDGFSDTSEKFRIVGTEPTRHILSRHQGSYSHGPAEGSRYSTTGSSSHTRYLLVSNVPFGIIIEQSDGRPGLLRFESARQIHLGELGRFVPIERPHIVYEPERQEGKRGWARLTDIASAVNLDPKSMITGFSPFGLLTPLLLVENPTQIETMDAEKALQNSRWLLRRAQFEVHPKDPSFWENLSSVWIAERFACDILRLHALGYVPPQQTA